MKTILLLLCSMLLLGCGEISPRKTYEDYFAKEKEGITSFDYFINSYTVRKQKEIEEGITESIERSIAKGKKRTRDEVIKASMAHFKRFATCKKLEFLNEEIDKNRAIITYKATDICSKKVSFNTELVYLVKENGSWKIDKFDIKI